MFPDREGLGWAGLTRFGLVFVFLGVDGPGLVFGFAGLFDRLRQGLRSGSGLVAGFGVREAERNAAFTLSVTSLSKVWESTAGTLSMIMAAAVVASL
jgi:hypothetical protein